MTQSRDELFLKLAIRQGLLTQQDSREQLLRYRTEGGAREGIGAWLVSEGIVSPEHATVIRNAIARRAEGHVDNTRKRVPVRARGGGSSAPPAQPVRRRSAAPRGVKVTGTQQALYIGAGVLTLVILIGLVFTYQKKAARRTAGAPASTNEQAAPEAGAGSGSAATGAATAAAAAQPAAAAPTWSAQELESMALRVKAAKDDALSHVGDGRPALGVRRVEKEVEELGGTLPPEIQTSVDETLQLLRDACATRYSELLPDLKAARADGADDDIADILLQIEETCGAEYAEKARAAN